MKHPSATEALKLAGSKCKSQHAFESTASKMLKRPEVIKYRKKLAAASTKRALRTKEEIIRSLENVAFADLLSLAKIDEDGNLEFKQLDELTPEQRSLLVSVTDKDTLYGKHRMLKLQDPLKAKELLMRHYNMFQEDNSGGAQTFAEALHKALSGQKDGKE
jgi:hypothetical protein